MASEVRSNGAREEIMRRISAAVGYSTGDADADAVVAEWEALPRQYKRVGQLGREQVLERLDGRLRDYDAGVSRARTGEVGAAIAARLAERGKRRVAVPAGLAEALGEALPEGFDFVLDEGLTTGELDEFDGVLTASTVAIAETGTIVLQNVPGQGRRAPTLVPDYHLCVVRAGDVVETVPEAMARLQATATLATTFISGPSATADIEMTRIKGVHGPRFLDVIVVE